LEVKSASHNVFAAEVPEHPTINALYWQHLLAFSVVVVAATTAGVVDTA